jgi:hypothetical protein
MELIIFLLVSIPLFGITHYLWAVHHERQVSSTGLAIQATILEVRMDEGDCIVRYRFVEPLSGKSYERSGIAGFLMNSIPKEGERIAVKYLASDPSWSRLVGEIKIASS